jgi:FKBP-type peptidyl-prolyl cis-trans isomerase
MRVGGTRRLRVPAELAFGDRPPEGSGLAHGESVTYEITLLAVSRRRPE